MPPELSNSQGLESAILAIAQAIQNNRGATKQINFNAMGVDSGGGAAMFYDMGSVAQFTSATPSAFARQNTRVPIDYRPNTDLTIRIQVSATVGSTHQWEYYTACLAPNNSIAGSWNVHVGATYASATYAANILRELVITIPASYVMAGSFVAFAIRPKTNTPNQIVHNAILEYQAN